MDLELVSAARVLNFVLMLELIVELIDLISVLCVSVQMSPVCGGVTSWRVHCRSDDIDYGSEREDWSYIKAARDPEQEDHYFLRWYWINRCLWRPNSLFCYFLFWLFIPSFSAWTVNSCKLTPDQQTPPPSLQQDSDPPTDLQSSATTRSHNSAQTRVAEINQNFLLLSSQGVNTVFSGGGSWTLEQVTPSPSGPGSCGRCFLFLFPWKSGSI